MDQDWLGCLHGVAVNSGGKNQENALSWAACGGNLDSLLRGRDGVYLCTEHVAPMYSK